MEKFQNISELNFETGKIGRLFSRIFFPTLAAMIFNSILTIIDGMFVGHFVGSIGLAAVNIISPTYMLSTGIGLMFGIGASVLAGIKLSARDNTAAGKITTQAFFVGLSIMLIISSIAILFPTKISQLLGATPELMPEAKSYLLSLVASMSFIFIESCGMMFIRLDGSPKYAMWCQIVPVPVNIILDYILVAHFRMGVLGAGLATSISCIIGGVGVMAYFQLFSRDLKFYRFKATLSNFINALICTWRVVRIGFPTFLSEFAMSIMLITGNYVFLNLSGETGVAAFSIACYLFPVVFSINNAVAQSEQPIISFNYGLRNWSRIYRTLRIALFAAFLCGLTITVALIYGNSLIVSIFIPSGDHAFEIACHGLPLFGLCAVFFSMNITFIGYYQSIEKGALPTVYTLLRGLIFLVPAFVIMSDMAGIDGAWLAIPMAELLTFITITAGFIIKYNKHKTYE